MNLQFLLTTDACETSSSSCWEVASPSEFAAKAVVALVPGSPVSQKGHADFARAPVGVNDQISEQSADCLPPFAMCDSNTRQASFRYSPYNGDLRLHSWPSSLSRLYHASDECARTTRNPAHAQHSVAAEPWQRITLFPSDNQTSTRSHRSPLRTTRASPSITKHGKEKRTSSKTHTCFCGRAFNKREHLKRHNLLVHEEVRPFTCEDCDLHFGTKQNFQVHLSTRKHRQRVLFKQPTSRGDSAEAVRSFRGKDSTLYPPSITDQSANQ